MYYVLTNIEQLAIEARSISGKSYVDNYVANLVTHNRCAGFPPAARAITIRGTDDVTIRTVADSGIVLSSTPPSMTGHNFSTDLCTLFSA